MSLKKVDISIGLIKLNSSFVCLKRTSQPYKNFIEFPGGKKRNNETAIQCLKREIKEELNIEVDKSKFISTIKHLYGDALVIINIFYISRYTGYITSNENRDIVLFDAKCKSATLPTHDRILSLLKLPKLLKIITPANLDDTMFENINLYKYIRLRDISYNTYNSSILSKLEKYHFKGNLIIDYPYNKDWADKYSGVHFKSCFLENFIDQDRRKEYLYSASCHNLNDIEISNKKLFDFIMISPILKSHNNFKAIGWDKFNILSKESYLPTYALGGVSSKGSDLANCIYNHGFGLAGISSI
tara:strand:+ start:753 stop:1652 length:900 start_codon:yes stop_codon:yes gene_type:complete